MKRFILCIAILATGFAMPEVNAQVTDSLVSADSTQLTKKEKNRLYYAERSRKLRLEQLAEEKENILMYEKNILKMEIERIDTVLASGKITADQAKEQKMEVARIAALNIDNKTAIIDNQLALEQRGNKYTFQYRKGSSIELGFGNAYDDNGSFLLGFGYTNESTKVRYDKRTYSDVVLAMGRNNAVREGITIWDSPYKLNNSYYYELGYTFRTRVFQNTNAVRFVYGLSMQFQHLESDNSKYFEDQNGQTAHVDYGSELKKSNLRFDNIVLPIFFEFGPSRKIETIDRVRYDTRTSFKFGIGGFAGLNLSTVQRLKYNFEGETIVQKTRADFNTNKFVYGLNTYVGFGATSIFLKYDLNPTFDNGVKQNNVAAGLRFDF